MVPRPLYEATAMAWKLLSHLSAAAAAATGREGRGEFGARSNLKKKKTGGLSNREKDKRKNLPFAARSGQVSNRSCLCGCWCFCG
jgi:hypothetical protein